MPDYGAISSPSLQAGKEQLMLDQKEEASMVTAGGKRRRRRKTRRGGKGATFNAPYHAASSDADNARLAELAQTHSNISQMNKGTEVQGGGKRRRRTKYKRKRKSKRVKKSKKRRRRSRRTRKY